MSTTDDSRTTGHNGPIIDEDGIPSDQAGPSDTQAQQPPWMNGGVLGAPQMFDPFKGKHPLKTKTGWKLVGLAAIGIAVIVGLIFLTAVVLTFVVPALLIVAALFWLGRKLGGGSRRAGSGIARR